MIHEVETVDWGEIHSYQNRASSTKIELTLPVEEMWRICRKFDLLPELGAGEAQYPAFRDWLEKHDKFKALFYEGKNSYDILSLVSLFDDDLKQFSKVIAERNAKESKHPLAN